MILTVTLNAAIDRTVAVPNFRLGHRHRAVESTHRRRRQGRQRRPGAEAAGPAGDRHRARRAARPATASWSCSRASRSSTTSPGSRASRAPTSRWSTRPRASRPRSTSGARRCSERGDRGVRGEAALPRAGGDDLRDRGKRPARRSTPSVYARLVAGLREHGVLTRARLRRRADARRPPRRARGGGAERARGRGRGRATSSPTRPTSSLGLDGLIEMGAGEAIITRENGCVAIVGEEGTARRSAGARARRPAGHPLRGRDRAARAGLDGGLGRRFPGRLRRRPLRRGLAARVPRARRRLRGRVDAALRRRAPSTAAEVERLVAQVEVRELEVPARRRLAARARRLTAVIIAGALGSRPQSPHFPAFEAPRQRGFFVRAHA